MDEDGFILVEPSDRRQKSIRDGEKGVKFFSREYVQLLMGKRKKREEKATIKQQLSQQQQEEEEVQQFYQSNKKKKAQSSNQFYIFQTRENKKKGLLH